MDELEDKVSNWVSSLPHSDSIQLSLKSFNREEFNVTISNVNGNEEFSIFFGDDAVPQVIIIDFGSA